MKTQALIAAALLAGGMMLTSTADAATRKVRVCETWRGTTTCTTRWVDTSDQATRIRARNLDPAGDYAGYPAWAQFALSPKLDNGYRR